MYIYICMYIYIYIYIHQAVRVSSEPAQALFSSSPSGLSRRRQAISVRRARSGELLPLRERHFPRTRMISQPRQWLQCQRYQAYLKHRCVASSPSGPPPDPTPGPSNLNRKSILGDFDDFWRQMPTKWLQERSPASTG